MRTYQTVLILKPDADEAEIDKANDKVGEYISKDGGSILRTDKWGKKRLAYKVKKNRFGIYLNIFHTCEQLKIKALERELGLDESIIKYMVVRLDDKEQERVFAQESPAVPDTDDSKDKPENKPKDKPEDKSEDKPEDKPKDKPKDKPEDKSKDKPEDKSEDKPEDKPED